MNWSFRQSFTPLFSLEDNSLDSFADKLSQDNYQRVNTLKTEIFSLNLGNKRKYFCQMHELNKVHYCDWLENNLSDKSVQLIIADPPYFEVKGDFDFVWKSFDDYLKDVEKWAIECKRVLADNGTLFWYGHAKKIAYAQIIFDKYFKLENSIAIEFNRQTKKGVDLFRCFAPVSERLLMYSNDFSLVENNPFCEIIRKYRVQNKLSTIELAERGKFYGNVNHGGAVANWEKGKNIPSSEQWALLCEILNISISYNKLFEEYQLKRRYFDNKFGLFDIMKFDQEAHITRKFDHDTVKPETLSKSLILTCSRPNDLVLVPFAGSGTECAMSLKEQRRFIGFDINYKYVEMANERCWNVAKTPQLF